MLTLVTILPGARLARVGGMLFVRTGGPLMLVRALVTVPRVLADGTLFGTRGHGSGLADMIRTQLAAGTPVLLEVEAPC